MRTMPIADAHIHLFSAGYPGRYGRLFPKGGELRTYEAIRRAHAINRALVVGFEAEPWARGNNRYISRLACKRRWMIPLAFCAASDLIRAPQFPRWWKAGFYGISLYLSSRTHLRNILAWDAGIFSALNRKKAIISLNVGLDLIAGLRPFFARLPETRILVSHMGLPGAITKDTSPVATRKRLAPLLRQYDLPHVGVKLSGFYACNDYPHTGISSILEPIVREFGEKRIYWGSDFSPALDCVSFAQTIAAAPQSHRGASLTRRLFRQNLEEIVKRVG